MPNVSVVIPTYNRPQFLKGAIETAVSQTYTDLEVVVVDDGSNTEYATEIVSQYSDDVRCITHDENRGLSAARNTGIADGDGEYIAFLDDDDRWDKNKLAKQVNALKATPEAGLATCRLASINSNGNLLRCDGAVVDGDIADEIYTRNLIGTPSRVMIQKDALSNGQAFDETLSTKQDWDFYIRLCQEWSVVGVYDILCFRTRHGGMASDPEDAKADNMKVIEKHRHEIEQRGLWSETMANYNQKVGVTYLLDGQGDSARDFLYQSFLTDLSVINLILIGLSFVPYSLFHYILRTKRWYERMTRNCESKITWEHVHGVSGLSNANENT